MRAVQVVIMYLCYLAVLFLSMEAATLSDASELKKRMNAWSLSRPRRTIGPQGKSEFQRVEVSERQFVSAEDMKDNWQPDLSLDNHIRVKRYRQGGNSLRTGCRFGTCTLPNLAHQIYQLTDKDKDNVAPASKISPQGYGRRKRSLPENNIILRLIEGRLRPIWSRTRRIRTSSVERDGKQSAVSSHRSGLVTELRQPWDTFLRRT